jgi:hypothetical protein
VLALGPLSALWLAACGARTGLDGPDAGGPALDAPALRDAPLSDAPGLDAPRCASAAECDDGASCTDEACVEGRCVSAPDDARCDDGAFCSGVERCSPGPLADRRGCTLGAPVVCGDGVACTVDVCDEALDACVSVPEASLCPVSYRCDPARGCQARALVHDPSFLYEIDLPGGELNLLAPLPVELTDLALNADGRLYGPANGALYRVDYAAGTADRVVEVAGIFNALDFAPSGALFGAVDDRIVEIDLARGTLRTAARFPPMLQTSGDIAFVGERLFATTTTDAFGSRSDVLVEVDLAAGTSRVVNSVGERCVWGLAPLGEELFGVTCEGLLLRIDTSTGRGEVLRRSSAVFFGAGAR